MFGVDNTCRNDGSSSFNASSLHNTLLQRMQRAVRGKPLPSIGDRMLPHYTLQQPHLSWIKTIGRILTSAAVCKGALKKTTVIE